MFNLYKSGGSICNVNRTASIISNSSSTAASPFVRKMAGAALNVVVEKLNEFAPENLAEKWDNVGLLIEPFTKRQVWGGRFLFGIL